MGTVLPTTFFGQGAPAAAATPAVTAAPAVVAVAAAVPTPELLGSDKVGPVILRDETVAQMLELLQRWTGKSVLRPQALPANVYTLSLPASITRDEALLAIETLLNLNGIAVIQQGDKFLKVVPNLVAKAESPTLLMESTLKMPPSGRIASKIFTLKHASGQEMVVQISGMLNTTLASPPIYFARNNALLVTDSITNLQKVENLVLQLDRPQLDVIATKTYSLTNAVATDLVNKLTALLRTPAATGGAPFRLSTGTSFTADERTNRIILMGSADQHEFFDKLINTLDSASAPNTKTDVIALRHSDATQVATMLTQLVTGQVAAATKASGTSKTSPGARAATPVVAAPVAVAAAAPSAAGAAQAGADEFSNTVTVLPDVRSNSIIVSGTKDDLRLLRDLIEKVDGLLPQVRVEVVIAEVTLTDSDTSGISSLNMTVTNGKLTSIGGTFLSAAGANGSSLGGLAGGQATINSSGNLTGIIGLATTPAKNDARILSCPAITTTHNKEATIFVGESLPVITGVTSTANTSSSTGLTTSSTVSMRDIGIQLKVLPLIGKDGAVQLQVSQSVEDIIDHVMVDGNSQPIIGRRTTDSFVSAMSGEIIVLGGLQRRQKIKSTSRLGPIPFLSDLFGGSQSDETRTELVMFLRPYVLTNTAADNIDGLSRVDASSLGPEARQVLDRIPGQPVAAPAKK
ncbi:MAG: type II secretory pathway, component PulD [Verrucomicrobia bacterium]|nr:type II secretory pathway, component PulD [Verrucomicrobiota bacterium]